MKANISYTSVFEDMSRAINQVLSLGAVPFSNFVPEISSPPKSPSLFIPLGSQARPRPITPTTTIPQKIVVAHLWPTMYLHCT